jgi:3alpha(or 20beta)-hydroxysteroid dehydrogenase
MGRVERKVALVTGGARGQGAAHARLLVAEGARVVIGDVVDADGAALVADLGDDVRYVHHDVTSERDWQAAVGAATETFGRLDILVNNAGIWRQSKLIDTSLDDYMAVIAVNQVGTFLGMKTSAPAMAESGGGSIVNISSTSGLVGSRRLVAYTASKWAVRGMTKVAALELASVGIRVNAVFPGPVDTTMLQEVPWGTEAMLPGIPLRRVATPDEVAHMVLWLASDESSYCTGSDFVMDGGVTAG